MMAVGKFVAKSALAATVARVACGLPGITEQSEGGGAHENIEVLVMPCLLSKLVGQERYTLRMKVCILHDRINSHEMLDQTIYRR